MTLIKIKLTEEQYDDIKKGNTCILSGDGNHIHISLKKPEINREKLQKILDKLKGECFDGCPYDCIASFYCGTGRTPFSIRILEELLK